MRWRSLRAKRASAPEQTKQGSRGRRTARAAKKQKSFFSKIGVGSSGAFYLIYRIVFRQTSSMMSTKIHLTKAEAFTNARIKYYPNSDKPVELLCFDRPVFNPLGVEKSVDKISDVYVPKSVEDPDESEDEKGESLSRQCFNRARKRAYDFIRCNPQLNTFLTLTFNGEMVDRSSYSEIVKKLNTWLDNRVRRQNLSYILCPEYHKDGENIHFHGLSNFEALRLENSGHKRKGKAVYNITDFPYGFTTAIKVTGDQREKYCAGYIFKYMGKQGLQKVGGRYFLSGGDLSRPRYEYLNLDYDALDLKQFNTLSGAVGKAISGDENSALIDSLRNVKGGGAYAR